MRWDEWWRDVPSNFSSISYEFPVESTFQGPLDEFIEAFETNKPNDFTIILT